MKAVRRPKGIKMNVDEVEHAVNASCQTGFWMLGLRSADDAGTAGRIYCGPPEQSANSEWPKYCKVSRTINVPTHFLLQLNSADTPRCANTLELPETGMLLFFYDSAYSPTKEHGTPATWALYQQELLSVFPKRNATPGLPVDNLYMGWKAPDQEDGCWEKTFKTRQAVKDTDAFGVLTLHAMFLGPEMLSDHSQVDLALEKAIPLFTLDKHDSPEFDLKKCYFWIDLEELPIGKLDAVILTELH